MCSSALNETIVKHLAEQHAKMLQANKIVDEKLLTSDTPGYKMLRQAIADKDIGNEHLHRKVLYLGEMDKINGIYTVDWNEEIRRYVEYQTQFQEVSVYLDGKYVVYPKKGSK